jgi:RHS repeat-associated protein
MALKRFVWDRTTDAYLMEKDGAGNTTAVYTQQPVPYGRLISQRRGGVTSYHHYDALGSTRALTNAAQTVTDTNLYDAWGVNVASTGSTANPFKWLGAVGYYFDAVLGDYYVRARNYSPRLGRWTSADPLLFVDGANLFLAYFVPNSTDARGTDLDCDCPGGNWTHKGSSLSIGLVYQYSRYSGTAVCDKERITRRMVYDCNGSEIIKNFRCWCEADIVMSTHCGGVIAGGGYSAFLGGTITGAFTCRALNASGTGWNWGLSVGPIGVEGGGSPESGGYGGLNAGISLEAGIGYGKTWTSVSDCRAKCREDDFAPQEKEIAKQANKAGRPCKVKQLINVEPPEVGDNTNRP